MRLSGAHVPRGGQLSGPHIPRGGQLSGAHIPRGGQLSGAHIPRGGHCTCTSISAHSLFIPSQDCLLKLQECVPELDAFHQSYVSMLGTKVCSRHPPAQRFSEVCVALENDWRSLLERLKGSVEEMAVQVCVHSVALITTVISLCLQRYYTVVKLFHSSLVIPVPLHFRTGTNMASRSGALHAGVSVDSSPAGRRSLQDGRAGRAHNGLEPSSGGEKHHPVVPLRPYRAPVVGSNRTRCSSFVFGWRQKPACSTCALSFKTMRSCCFIFFLFFPNFLYITCN